MTDYKDEITRINGLFYEAFSTANLELMAAVWKQDPDVTVIHPGHEMLRGYQEVMESWENILAASTGFEISCCNVAVLQRGDLAYVVCNELLPGHTLIATNIYLQDGSGWKLIHHQAGPSPSTGIPENTGSVH